MSDRMRWQNLGLKFLWMEVQCVEESEGEWEVYIPRKTKKMLRKMNTIPGVVWRRSAPSKTTTVTASGKRQRIIRRKPTVVLPDPGKGHWKTAMEEYLNALEEDVKKGTSSSHFKRILSWENEENPCKTRQKKPAPRRVLLSHRYCGPTFEDVYEFPIVEDEDKNVFWDEAQEVQTMEGEPHWLLNPYLRKSHLNLRRRQNGSLKSIKPYSLRVTKWSADTWPALETLIEESLQDQGKPVSKKTQAQH